MLQFFGSVPGKTFLVGEYVALLGGPALVVATEPRFEMRIYTQAKKEADFQPHPESPAGRLLTEKKTQLDMAPMHIQFTDPYNNRGGFGASTAQYLLLSAYFSKTSEDSNFDLHQVLSEYKKQSLNKHGGVPPSGYDLVGQTLGQVTFFEKNTGKLEQLKWPFEKLHLSLFSTGNKVATHDYLRDIKDVNYSSLQDLSEKAVNSFKNKDEEQFRKYFAEFRQELQRLELVHPQSLSHIHEFEKISGVIAKGCGALGADVIAVLSTAEQLEAVKTIALKRDLQLQASEQNLTEGLESENFQENFL